MSGQARRILTAWLTHLLILCRPIFSIGMVEPRCNGGHWVEPKTCAEGLMGCWAKFQRPAARNAISKGAMIQGCGNYIFKYSVGSRNIP